MSPAVVLSRGLAGLEAPLVTVEVYAGNGLPGVNLVGLPETEVKEARDRVRAALQNAQFEFPPRKIAVQWLYNYGSIAAFAVMPPTAVKWRKRPRATFWTTSPEQPVPPAGPPAVRETSIHPHSLARFDESARLFLRPVGDAPIVRGHLLASQRE